MDKESLEKIGEITKNFNIKTDLNSDTLEKVAKEGLPYYAKYLLVSVFGNVIWFIFWVIFVIVGSKTATLIFEIIAKIQNQS